VHGENIKLDIAFGTVRCNMFSIYIFIDSVELIEFDYSASVPVNSAQVNSEAG